jgi:CheY-like chemotaxis protein
MNASPRRIESGTIRRGRVLVVDDEAFEGKKLAKTLIEHGVVAVSSGADALAVIAVGRPYDLVLCDVMLCDMTGVELLSRLRRDHPDQAKRLVFMARRRLSPVLHTCSTACRTSASRCPSTWTGYALSSNAARERSAAHCWGRATVEHWLTCDVERLVSPRGSSHSCSA